jgi:hypothetical protein
MRLKLPRTRCEAGFNTVNSEAAVVYAAFLRVAATKADSLTGMHNGATSQAHRHSSITNALWGMGLSHPKQGPHIV